MAITKLRAASNPFEIDAGRNTHGYHELPRGAFEYDFVGYTNISMSVGKEGYDTTSVQFAGRSGGAFSIIVDGVRSRPDPARSGMLTPWPGLDAIDPVTAAHVALVDKDALIGFQIVLQERD